MSGAMVRVRLEPSSVEMDVARGAALLTALGQHGFEFPCGGTGLCGGCSVRVLGGELATTQADREVFTAAELAAGWRLACQARVEEPLTLECRQWRMDVLADDARLASAGRRGLGIAIDLGTTTIAAQLIDLAVGSVLRVETELNPQAAFGADVMSRIKAALAGDDLTAVVRGALRRMVASLVAGHADQIVEVVLVGNTVMHHLFAGLDVEPLAHVPFETPHAEAQRFTAGELSWPLAETCAIRFERCLGSFVGSDILAGIVAVGMHRAEDLMALVDLGTNGEIAIGNRAGIVCASAAAGPAFEAGAIRMGMRATTGAVWRVENANGQMRASVIGNVEPMGICGSGLVDAVAAGLQSGAILASGRIADGSKHFPVAGDVILSQADIRELQLAKGAIASGFKLLLRRIGATADGLKSIYLAGAFGNYVQMESALRIGLLDARGDILHAAGNTALRGAKMMLLADAEPAMPKIEHVSLAADPGFQDEFAACMSFPVDFSR
jgi:uncharacterized 2Fe-2S/4Fe-4S cluster protein (DUF4445 family)